MAQDNKSLGQFILDGIPPAPRGVPQIEVAFDIDSNGILNVSAKDKGTGKSQSIRIEGTCGISDEEVERMKKEAEQYAEDDKKKSELIDIRNQSDQIIYSSEKMLKDSGDKISSDKKEKLEGALKELRDVQKEEEVEKIKEKLEALSSVAQEAGKEIHEQAQKEAQAQQTEEGKKEEGEQEKKEEGKDTQEGEYEEK